MSEPPIMPMRVEPVQYYVPQGSGRPGVLTAVAIVSIVIASLGVLGGCAGLVSLLVFQNTVTSMRAAAAAPPPVATPAFPPAAPGPIASPRGLTPIQRDIVIMGMNRSPLTPQRRQMLDKLLADCGQDVLPFDPSSLTPAKVSGMVNETGELPGVAGKRGNTFYVLGTGRIEVADTHAVFAPTRGEKVRVAADDVETSPTNAPPGPAQLPSGATVIAAPAPFGSSTTSMRTYLIANGIGLLLNFALAMLLLAAAIMVLMNSPRGRGLHLAYAWIKIPVAIALALVNALTMKDMMAGLATGGTPLSAMTAGSLTLVSLVIGLILSCAYPVALLIVMRSKTINEYYSAVRVG